ncbi:DUF1476 domain-containing protein [Croceibacterium sp. TMG7-5b_MA50]|uniref:DUF1476 domain-containing protein n=1 Tax=Croceibacterium sp. TMG7-5b_MA50 TaxID=3121290 RepID=UPI0032214810
MTDFEDRRRAEEAKAALDHETAFRILARRNRLLGQWAAERMRLTPEETDAYAREVVHAEFDEGGDEAVIRKLLGDLTAAGVDASEGDLRIALEEQAVIARRHFMGEG